jgi:sigma-B regulation protein RsbU (phosphoserine phosphatase)
LNDEIEHLLPEVEPQSTLYVADDQLRVVYTNDEWRRFADDNKGSELAGPAWNTHLLDNMSGKARERWAAIYELLLEGRLPHYEEDFICSSPRERRIYRLRSTPMRQEDGGTLLVHHTVRIDDKAEERDAMRRRLRGLDTDPEQVEREYRSRVLEPRIEVPGFRAARHIRPLEEVGGDVVWHRRYEDGTTDLLLADAMGHGLEAGVHAAKLAMMLDSLAAPYRQPQDILASLNRGLLRHRLAHESAFASGILFRLRRGSPLVRCASFGHPAPIFSRSGEVDLEVGLALGIVDTHPVWSETELDLEQHGRRFLVFSDGITEQFDAQGEMYGTARLVEAFRTSLELDLDATLRHIVADLDAFRGEALVKDDQTMIALELEP